LFEEQSPAIQGGANIDLEQTQKRIDEVRRQIRRLGPINAEAPEDFREFRDRHEFLTTQMADLQDAEGQLREAIAELNEEIRARFGATFTKVDEAFSKYFSAFFGGGSANLLLTDPDNIAEAGIEIEAQPPGKRIKSLSLLSGGERSLTAVALLFALLSANPAPFCVLDEVDAALDEANVGRFTAALKDLAEKTQFLMVTHNRRSIEIADAIYGVSMGRDGVSKVLSLRLSDLPQN
jgi:chromosome segregation protein